MGLFKHKKELDSKSRHITVMYLHKAKTQLEKDLESCDRYGETEILNAKHDVKCLENAIVFLKDC